jgi:class 3 adenylate cyclase
LALLEQVGDQPAIANLLVTTGDLYLKFQNYSKSLDYCKRAFQLAKTVKHLAYQKDACKCLYESYKKINNSNFALKYLEVMSVLEDSLRSEETTIKLQQMEFQKQILADSIKQEEEKRKVKLSHEEDLFKKKRARNLSIGGGLIVLMFAIGLWVRLRWVRKSRFLLQKEKDRSEKLLLNILPVEIAEELKSSGKAEARNFEMVSILFTDFQDFTQIAQEFSAKELVEELNICFQEFDKICVKNGIEKIKTIGDSYMAAGGLPVPTNDSVKNTIVAALEMQDFIQKRKSENLSQRKPAFEMRAGVHTGTLVAGIVGLNKFQYDVWGDSVNTSSRMESNGRVGKVNISQDTYEFMKDDLNFTFENRGQIEVKGKGKVGMWFVMRRS